MSYADYLKVEQPNLHVFTEEEIELGDLPVDDKKDPPKDNRDAKKAERLAARQKQAEAGKKKGKGDGDATQAAVKDANDTSAHLFGERELNRSQCDPEIRFTKVFTNVRDITEAHKDQEIIVRGRYHASRGKGNLCFVILRQQFSTI